MVAGNGTPVIDASGANVDISFRHFSGGVEFQNLASTATLSYESNGQIVIASSVNASATITLRGNMSITNNSSAVPTVDAVFNRTNTIGGAYALDTDSNGRIRIVDGTGAGEIATTSGAIDNVTTVTGNVNGNVTGSVGSNLELGPAEVNAEVLDVLNTDTFGEPGQGTPGATVTLAAKIGYLYKAWRNRTTQTSSQYSLYNDDATTVDQKATFSDDTTTADRGEIATGP